MFHKIGYHNKLFYVIEFLLEILAVFASYFLLNLLGYVNHNGQDQTYHWMRFFASNAVYIVLLIILLRVFITSISQMPLSISLFRTILAVAVTIGLMLTIKVWIGNDLISVRNYFNLALIQVALLFSLKIILLFVLMGMYKNDALIIGPKEEVEGLAKKIFNQKLPVKIKYLIYENGIEDATYLNHIFKLMEDVDSIYLTDGLTSTFKDQLIYRCFNLQKPYFIMPKLYEIALSNAYVFHASDALVYYVRSMGLTIEQRFMKRFFDMIVASTLLILSLPFFILIALIIKISDRGPVFFKQERMTKYNKKFMIYKFRTMKHLAEKDTGPVQSSEDDQRLTLIGKLLRRVRMDEFPQMINVIKGDMSIVGPRALRVEEVEAFSKEDPKFVHRMNVKAGITGYAQVHGKYFTGAKEKLLYDMYYIANYSLIQDFIIILKTFQVILDVSSARGKPRDKTLDETLKIYFMKKEEIISHIYHLKREGK
jgi:exopolysaccharide biosynthesis polyprenyl glycosylphosphotransferase